MYKFISSFQFLFTHSIIIFIVLFKLGTALSEMTLVGDLYNMLAMQVCMQAMQVNTCAMRVNMQATQLLKAHRFKIMGRVKSSGVRQSKILPVSLAGLGRFGRQRFKYCMSALFQMSAQTEMRDLPDSHGLLVCSLSRPPQWSCDRRFHNAGMTWCLNVLRKTLYC